MLASMLCIGLIFGLTASINAAKILGYYPSPSISHQIVFQSITRELLNRGHQVTVVTPHPMFSPNNRPSNLTEIDIHDVVYNNQYKYFPESVTGKKHDLLNQIKAANSLNTRNFEDLIRLTEIKKLYSSPKDEFDLLLLESYITPALGLTYIFNAPAIMVSSLGSFPGNYDIVGAPTFPTVYRDMFRQRLYNVTMWEKITDIVLHFRIKMFIRGEELKQDKILQKVFGNDIPPLRVLKNNVDMLFLNINPIWEGNHPVPPSVIYMGAIHLRPPKKLPEHLTQYLEKSKNGFILFSLGTNVNTSLIATDTVKLFTNVLTQLPYNVVWKWDNDSCPIIGQNIKTLKWIPQADLLRHKKIKVFITQGGLQSIDEAIAAGVPVIGIPMLADQWFNTEKIMYHKIGIQLNLDDLTVDKFRNAIIEVAKNKSYRENIVRLRSLMQDQPQSPLERCIWWIEYVLRNGGAKHLRAPAANLSWIEFLDLELVLATLLTSFTIIVFFIFIFIYVMRILRNIRSINKIKLS